MYFRPLRFLAVTLLIGFVAGCKPGEPVSSSAGDPAYLLTAEPSAAVGVGEARNSSDEEVTLVGRIGGSEKPFVDGMAAFTIVDPKVEFCAPEENCPTPWDYCCSLNEVKDNIAMVKVVDAAGTPVAKDAKNLLGVNELALIVVHGKAQRDDQGNLTVLADKIFVKEKK